MPMVDFGEFLPDRQGVMSPGVETAKNVIPLLDGFANFPEFAQAATGALQEECRGAWSAKAQPVNGAGVNFAVAGDITETASGGQLYLNTAGDFNNVSKTGGYTVNDKDRWAFTLFDDNVIAANYNDATQSYIVPGSTNFADLSADAPRSRVVETVRNFVFAGDIVGQGVNAAAIGARENAIQWSAIGDPTSWPQVGTSAAQAVQSDWQPFPANGGRVTDIRGGFEFGTILREREVWRADYIGTAPYWQFSQVDFDRGCIGTRAAIQMGGNVYFPSEEGMLMFNGAGVVPIGNEKIDRTWLSAIDMDRINLVSTAQDPTRRLLVWSFPDKTNGKFVLFYNYALDRWSFAKRQEEWIFSVLPFGVSLDSSPYDTADMDAPSPGGLGDVDLDALTGSTDRTLAGFNATHRFGTYTSETRMLGEIETGGFEDPSGQRVLVRMLRPVFEGTGTILGQVSGRLAPSGDRVYQGYGSVKPNGHIPTRVSGRYLNARFYLVNAVDSFKGFDFIAAGKGRRS